MLRNQIVRTYPSGSRGSPAKGVVRETVARVQISPSAPGKYPYLTRYKRPFDAGAFSFAAIFCRAPCIHDASQVVALFASRKPGVLYAAEYNKAYFERGKLYAEIYRRLHLLF